MRKIDLPMGDGGYMHVDLRGHLVFWDRPSLIWNMLRRGGTMIMSRYVCLRLVIYK